MLKRLRVVLLTALIFPVPAQASAYYADPEGSGPLINAVSWLQGTLLGTVATVAAVIAVAVVGFMMLTGRMKTDVRVDGVDKPLNNRVITIWCRTGDDWRLVAFQSTPLAG